MSARRHIPYVNEEVANRDFKYYIFDWDDNILHMPTKIRLEHLAADGQWKPVEVSTSTFALVRSDTAHYRAPSEGGWAAAFRNFEDPQDPNARNSFIEDTVAALERKVEELSDPRRSLAAIDRLQRSLGEFCRALGTVRRGIVRRREAPARTRDMKTNAAVVASVFRDHLRVLVGDDVESRVVFVRNAAASASVVRQHSRLIFFHLYRRAESRLGNCHRPASRVCDNRPCIRRVARPHSHTAVIVTVSPGWARSKTSMPSS